MKIRIPEKRCVLCQFSDDFNIFHCHLFHVIKNNYDRLPECLKEFGDGGEFELIKKDKP